LQRDAVETAVMMVLMVEMMRMMIMMKSSLMAVAMAMISPSVREFSPTDSYLPESFSLSGVFRLVAAAEYFCELPPDLRFSWG
jgi:hypothetical protein